jgi:tetratricopeptide (TPR) repeat protein
MTSRGTSTARATCAKPCRRSTRPWTSTRTTRTLKPLTEDILYGSPEKAWGNLGWAYLEKGDSAQAIDALRRAVASQPRFCVGNYRLGVAYEKESQLKAAKDALTRALETDRPGCPNMQEALETRGRVSMRLGETLAARQDFAKCVTLSKITDSGERCETALNKLGGPPPAAPKPEVSAAAAAANEAAAKAAKTDASSSDATAQNSAVSAGGGGLSKNR